MDANVARFLRFDSKGDLDANGHSAHLNDAKHKKRMENVMALGGFGRVLYAFKEYHNGHEPRWKKITSNGMMWVTNSVDDNKSLGTLNEVHFITFEICRPCDIFHFRGQFDHLHKRAVEFFPQTLIAKARAHEASGIIRQTMGSNFRGNRG